VRTLCLLFQISMLTLGATHATAQARDAAPGPDTPAARRAAEVLSLVDSGDRAAARAYIASGYADEFRRLPMDAHLSFLSGLHDRTRGVELRRIESTNETEATALFRGRLTGDWEALVVRVEPAPPHRVTGLGLRPPALRDDERAAPAASDEDAASRLDRYVATLADADVFSGAVLLARGEEVLLARAHGEANKDFGAPNRVDTKFNLGSMNKMLTAVAIAQLVEQGRLQWDSPLSDFLTDFPTPDAARAIRVHHLLTHTSGLGSYFNPTFPESSRARWRTVDDMMALARGDSLAFEPGTRWQYSNTGYLVLGKIIEIVTGQDYHDYVREHIARPAGMLDTDAYELDRVNPNLAVGYQKVFTDGGTEYRNNLFEHVIRGGPAGGGYSTVEDLFRFARALRTGRLLQPETVALLTSPKPELGSPHYGYGFGINPDGSVGHTGGFPGISSALAIYPDDGYVVVVLANYGGAAPPVMRQVAELIANR
jgi:CubicO group peptidase (beta-lactamase class C family)